MDLSLYIHVPFCRVRCRYCDFNTYAGLQHLTAAYVTCLAREIAEAPALLGDPARIPVSTVYIGGGTPTVLTSEQLERVLDSVRGTFALAPDAEVTLEANPGTVDLGSLREVRAMGVNRLSLGVQSLDEAALVALGRIHTAAEAQQAYAWARQSGFDNINLDFMYGLPGQDLAAWRRTLGRALALAPDHLSLYALTLEDDTPLGRDVACGDVTLPDDDVVADMYEAAEEILDQRGFVHYEISNWARPGHECRHNLVYWRNGAYLGFGAGAHSSQPLDRLNRRPGGVDPVPGACWVRWSNVPRPEDYIERCRRGVSLVGSADTLSQEDVMAETMFLGLRLVQEGVEGRVFRRRFGRNLGEEYGPTLRELAALGLLETHKGRLRLTAKGRLLGNEVFQRFLP